MPVRMRPFIMMFPAVMPRAVTVAVAVLCRHIALRQNRKIKIAARPNPSRNSPTFNPAAPIPPTPP